MLFICVCVCVRACVRACVYTLSWVKVSHPCQLIKVNNCFRPEGAVPCQGEHESIENILTHFHKCFQSLEASQNSGKCGNQVLNPRHTVLTSRAEWQKDDMIMRTMTHKRTYTHITWGVRIAEVLGYPAYRFGCDFSVLTVILWWREIWND